ncbi:MAG: AEC family transporter [Anaerolineae bacterium]|jgi:predicted permease
MPQGLVDALPILLLIGVGVLVRVSGLVNQKEGLVLTRVVYYVTIPAAIIVSIAGAQLTLAKVWLPVISLVMPCVLAGIMYLTTRRLLHQPELRGVLLVGMVVLAIFAYPFFELFYGPEGLANMAIYDVGNAIYAGPVALTLAQRFGSRRTAPLQRGAAWKRVAASPLLWAAVLGLAASLLQIEIRGVVGNTLQRLANANSPLAMVSVGIFLRPRRGHLGLVAQFVGLRMVLGGLLGWVMGTVVGLGGLDMITAIVGSSLPAGTTALIYAGNEGLDTEFAASMISFTVIIGAVVINVLPHLLASVYL